MKPVGVLTGLESGSVRLIRRPSLGGIGRGFGGAPLFLGPVRAVYSAFARASPPSRAPWRRAPRRAGALPRAGAGGGRFGRREAHRRGGRRSARPPRRRPRRPPRGSRSRAGVGAVLAVGGVGGDPGAVEGESPHRDEAGLGAEGEHLREELAELFGVTGAKAGDRRVVGPLVGRDHAEGDVLDQALLCPPRGALADRVGVEKEGDHHLGVVGGAAPAVVAVAGEERREINVLDRIEHEPGEVIVRKPLAQVGGQEHLLITVAAEEVLSHARIVHGAADEKARSAGGFGGDPQGFPRITVTPQGSDEPRRSAPASSSHRSGSVLRLGLDRGR